MGSVNADVYGGNWSGESPCDDNDGDGFEAWQECDDGDSNVYPLAGDVSGDGVDSDCDGRDCEAGYSTSGVYYAVCLPDSFANPAWTSMYETCNAMGYDGLASVRDATENEELRLFAEVVGNGALWGVAIDGTDADVEGNWVWSDGTSFVYENWGAGHYGGSSGENCIEMDIDGSSSNAAGSWNDCSCSSLGSTTGFACESR